MWSVSTRLISSGMVRSKLRIPADIDDGTCSLAAAKAPGERGVGVAIDDHGVEPAAHKAFLDGSQHPAGLHAMPARADVQVHVGVAEVQIAKELAAHVVVVMLAGMYQGLDVAPLAEFAAERRRLHELRPRPIEAHQLKRAACWIACH